MPRHRLGGKHRRQRRAGISLSTLVGTTAIVAAATGALTLPSAAGTPTAEMPTASAAASAAAEKPKQSAPSLGKIVEAQRSLTRVTAGQGVDAHRAIVEEQRAQARARAARAARLARMTVVPTTNYRLTASYGDGGGLWSSGRHTGQDFAAPVGTPVRSVTSGEVIEAGWAGAYGQQIKVRHADGTESWYNHLSKISVSSGKVTTGQVIGAVGTTGNSTGPHLHLEIHNAAGDDMDPASWLRKRGVRI